MRIWLSLTVCSIRLALLLYCLHLHKYTFLRSLACINISYFTVDLISSMWSHLTWKCLNASILFTSEISSVFLLSFSILSLVYLLLITYLDLIILFIYSSSISPVIPLNYLGLLSLFLVFVFLFLAYSFLVSCNPSKSLLILSNFPSIPLPHPLEICIPSMYLRSLNTGLTYG